MPVEASPNIPISSSMHTETAGSNVLDVPLCIQTRDNWCWAASCWMVGQLLHKDLTGQCQIATKMCPGTNCCAAAPAPICLEPQWPDAVYARHEIFCRPADGSLTPEKIKKEIDDKFPVQYYLDYGGGIAHTGLIIGYHSTGEFEVNDPKRGRGTWSYFKIRTGFDQTATWSKTYLFR